MVMAGTEGVPEPAMDEALSSRLQWLRQRREALQDKLAQKNNELKGLCIEEAELTGVLPPEIPLEPGESPPNFRKRVSANINYNHNLINKLKTNGTEESALEVERQTQIDIAEEALVILNDLSQNKAVRRKNRLIYQQTQRRLQEINVQLNFIRQSQGGALRHTQLAHIPLHSSQPHLQTAAKHRTKKPRPPLDNAGKDLSPRVESRGFVQEIGISLSPLGPEHNFNTYPNYECQELVNQAYLQPGSSSVPNQNRATYHAPSPVDQRRGSVKYPDDHNINNNVYVAPEHFRTRAYSQGGSNSGGSNTSPQHFHERVHRPVPNTYTEEERQMHYRQLKLRKENEEMLRNSQQYNESRHLDNEQHRRSQVPPYPEPPEFVGPRYDGQMYDYNVHYHHGKSQQPPPILRHRDNVDNVILSPEHGKPNKPPVDPYAPPGYWMRLNDDIVWCPEEPLGDRFGSLDRRKQNVSHLGNAETQSRYHTVAISGKNAVVPHMRPYPVQPQVHSPEVAVKVPGNNRMLLRTQSLGSVETWPPVPPTPSSQDGSSSVEGGRESADGMGLGFNKLKEKEWYETSLDGGGPPPRAVRRASQHNPLAPGPTPKERGLPVRSNSIPSNRRPPPRELHPPPPPPPPPPLPQQQQQQQHQHQHQHQHQQQQQQQQQLANEEPLRLPVPQPRYTESRVLEIPAESKPSPGSQENGNESVFPLNSPTNHTVVQPGKYQPYREVTKPFEMSDFYKYSTKFRKRVDANTSSEQQQQQQPQTSPGNLNTQNDQNQPNNNPMQRIHQPVQRNNPPYTLR